MKFAEKLNAHLTPEWRKQYIDYDGLKEFLLTYVDKNVQQTMDREWDAEFVATLNEKDNEFFANCTAQLEKIDSFFAEKLAEAKRKFTALAEELDNYLDQGLSRGLSIKSVVKRKVHEQRSSDGELESEMTVGKYREYTDNDVHVRERRYPSAKNEATPLPKLKRKKEKVFRRLQDIKLAFQEFYLSLVLLQNYQTLNYTGFKKITKKHDKLFRRTSGTQWFLKYIEGADFYTSDAVDKLIADTEETYIQKIENGNRSKSMKRLKVPPLSERSTPKSIFLFGLFAGIFFMQSAVMTLTYFFLQTQPEDNFPAIRIFRSTFLIILFMFLFGINTWGWRRSGVNHVLIFEINPRTHLDHFQLLGTAFFFADIWGFAVIFYMYSAVLQVPGYISPFVLVLFLLLALFNPFKFGYHRARRWLLRVLGRCFGAPFFDVKFADFWLADQLNSLSFILPELAFFICFYSSQIDWKNGMQYVSLSTADGVNGTQATVPSCAVGTSEFISNSCQCSGFLFGLDPILKVIPAWMRFAQCLRRFHDMKKKKLLPHIINAGKYSTTFLTSACTIWYDLEPGHAPFVFLVLASIINSTYSYIWDVRMDWGLFEDKEYQWLREETVYHHVSSYYMAIAEDFLLRYTWIIRISVKEVVGNAPTEMISTILSIAEVIRRFIWNFFRLENEHLNNCGEFRAVRDINITPINRTEKNIHNSHHRRHHSRRHRPHQHAPESRGSPADSDHPDHQHSTFFGRIRTHLHSMFHSYSAHDHQPRTQKSPIGAADTDLPDGQIRSSTNRPLVEIRVTHPTSPNLREEHDDTHIHGSSADDAALSSGSVISDTESRLGLPGVARHHHHHFSQESVWDSRPSSDSDGGSSSTMDDSWDSDSNSDDGSNMHLPHANTAVTLLSRKSDELTATSHEDPTTTTHWFGSVRPKTVKIVADYKPRFRTSSFSSTEGQNRHEVARTSTGTQGAERIIIADPLKSLRHQMLDDEHTHTEFSELSDEPQTFGRASRQVGSRADSRRSYQN